MNDNERRATVLTLLVGMAVSLALFGPCAKPAKSDQLPGALALYVPVDYYSFDDAILGARLGLDDDRAPALWLWPDGRTNLVGVRFAFWNPPMRGAWSNPKSKRAVVVNYLGWSTATPAVGDTLTFSGFMVQRFAERTGVADLDVTTLRRGRAEVLAVSDSVVLVRATIAVGCPAWSADWTDTTYARLVPETYRPGQ